MSGSVKGQARCYDACRPEGTSPFLLPGGTQGNEDHLPFPFAPETEEGKVQQVLHDLTDGSVPVDDKDSRHALAGLDALENEPNEAFVMSEEDASVLGGEIQVGRILLTAAAGILYRENVKSRFSELEAS